jgi:hypothetical protein
MGPPAIPGFAGGGYWSCQYVGDRIDLFLGHRLKIRETFWLHVFHVVGAPCRCQVAVLGRVSRMKAREFVTHCSAFATAT